MPFDERRAQGIRDLLRQHGFARSRLSFHQQWAFEGYRGVYSHHQVFSGNVRIRARKSVV